jgi:hypothetical protein
MSLNVPVSPSQTIRSIALGYLPRVLQVRGWLIAGLLMMPVGIVLVTDAIMRAKTGRGVGPSVSLSVYHGVLIKMMLPIMALIAAPGGVREDIEQRTLPLLLVRPSAIWAYPIGKGLPWFAWGAVWIIVGVLGLQMVGGDSQQLLSRIFAAIGAWWGELALMTLLGLLFKRGTLWGGMYFFIWELIIASTGILPAALQRLTFSHHVESLAGSSAASASTASLLAQAQVTSSPWASALALTLFGLVCWMLAGLKLHHTPLGLAGGEAEG